MNKTNVNTPTKINYQVQQAIEQMVAALPKGTDLGLVDVMSAMLSGYFVESGGGIMPALDQYLATHLTDEQERAARSRRAAKAVTYGQYNLEDLMAQLQTIVAQKEEWQPTLIEGYQLKPVDMTAFKRVRVKRLKSKSYDSTARRALPATVFGMIGTAGTVNGHTVALLETLVCGNTSKNEPSQEMKRLYQQVAKQLGSQEIALFDAGFSIIDALIHGITHCIVRLASNCTFGRQSGKIPPQTSNRGRPPSRHQADIVRPLGRQHGEKTLPQTPPDETMTWMDESGKEVKAEVWMPLYLLERHLDRVADEKQKETLRDIPLKLIALHHPDYADPILLGTLLTHLMPQSMGKMYQARWSIEGIPQTAKYLLSGGGGRHYVHHQQAMQRLPALAMIFGSLFKYIAATLPPMRSGFWDRIVKPTYGRLMRYLKKVGLPLSEQLCKKQSITSHLPVGYRAVALSKA